MCELSLCDGSVVVDLHNNQPALTPTNLVDRTLLFDDSAAFNLTI